LEAIVINNNIGRCDDHEYIGILGYLMNKFKYEGAPLILALVLGPMFENALRSPDALAWKFQHLREQTDFLWVLDCRFS